MVDLQTPLTHRRYLAELNNLIQIRARPVYMNGRPLATMDQIHDFIGGMLISHNELRLGSTVIVINNDYTALFSLKEP